MDDTIRTGPQASEDVIRTLMNQGQVPGVRPVSRDELDRVEGSPLILYPFPRFVVEAGRRGGQVARENLMEIPEHHHGDVMVLFDGWADDPRPLFAIPVVVDFMAELLMGEDLTDTQGAVRVLQVLVDERRFPNPEDRAMATGRNWVTCHAWASTTFQVHGEGWDRITRDEDLGEYLMDSLRVGHIPPGLGQVDP